jgi:hypothetical protein
MSYSDHLKRVSKAKLTTLNFHPLNFREPL